MCVLLVMNIVSISEIQGGGGYYEVSLNIVIFVFCYLV